MRLALAVLLLLSCQKPRQEFRNENGWRVLASPSGSQTIQMVDGGATGLYFDAATDVLKAFKGRRIERIVLLGMGGGEMLRQAHAVVPDALLVGVEIDPETLDLALTKFDLPRPIATARADAIEWIKIPGNEELYDVVMVDLFVDSQMVSASTKPEFLSDCARALRPGGLFLMNVSPDSRAPELEAQLRAYFTVSRRRYDNWVLVGVKGP